MLCIVEELYIQVNTILGIFRKITIIYYWRCIAECVYRKWMFLFEILERNGNGGVWVRITKLKRMMT